MQPLRESAFIPDVPGRTFVPRGHRGVGELFVQEQRTIVSAGREREGRGLRGSFRGTAGMY